MNCLDREESSSLASIQPGRLWSLLDVLNRYDGHFKLNLTEADKKDLVEYLKGSRPWARCLLSWEPFRTHLHP